MSAILRSPITWILVTLGIASGVGQKTRTKRKKRAHAGIVTFSTKKGQVRKTARRAYVTKPKKELLHVKQSQQKRKRVGVKEAKDLVRLLSQK